MQNAVIMAFRKRLKKRGYKDISIKISYPEKIVSGFPVYDVYATEPLGKTRLRVEYCVINMNRSFKHPHYVGYPGVPDNVFINLPEDD